MNFINQVLKNEKSYFNKLNNQAKHLLISNFLYGLGVPLITSFTNAFIWKNSHEFASVAAYNIGNWIILPIIFFANGFLLQYIPSSLIFSLGLIFTALAPFFIIILGLKGLVAMFLAGIFFGIGWGFYWANRHLYTLHQTEDSNRNYFYSLSIAVDTMTGIVIPFVIGWFIVFGGTFAYQILAFLLLSIYIVAGLSIRSISVKPNEHEHGFLTKVKGKWNLFRLVFVLFGFQSGLNLVILSLMILYLLGNEGILGSINSLGAILSALILYQIGKVSLSHHRIHVFSFGITILTIGTILFVLFPYGWGVICYVIAAILTSNFTWSAYNPILMDMIDRYTPTQKQNRFKYLVDHEIFLNIGRVLGIGLFFFLYVSFSKLFALHFTPLIVTSLQIVVVVLLSKVIGKKPLKQVAEVESTDLI